MRCTLVSMLALLAACAADPDSAIETGSSTTAASTGSSSSATSLDPATAASSDDATTIDTTAAAPDVGVNGCAVEWLPPVCWGDVACDEFQCGQPWSLLDADACARAECITDSDCVGDRHCSPRLLAAPCVQSLGCSDTDGACVCAGNVGCNVDPRGYCLDREEFPPAEVCAATHVTCEDLPATIGQTVSSMIQSSAELVSELASTVSECQAVRVERALGECGVSPCAMACAVASISCGSRACEADCAAADPDDAVAFATLIATTPEACTDCPTCERSGNPLCSTLGACGG